MRLSAWRSLCCALLALLALLPAGCGPAPPLHQESFVFGTRVELLIAGVPEEQARAAGNQVLAEFDRLHRTYHAWQPSELSTLNAALAAGKSLEVSDEFAAYLREAQEIARAGDFLFDPGIGRLIELWGFHTDEIQPHIPPPAELAALVAQHPSIAALSIKAGHCPEPRSSEPKSPPSAARGMGGGCIESRNNSVAIDFGGYLKGIALDRAAVILKAAGIRNALINIGGNILALGDKNGVPWRVGIQHPRPETVGGAPLASLELHDGEAIGTSGDYQRYFMVDGQRYSHLIDPRTGQPAQGAQAVTLLIPPGPQAGMRSDALSKPIFIAGADWQALAAKLGVTAVLKVGADGTVKATPAMRQRLKIEAPGATIDGA